MLNDILCMGAGTYYSAVAQVGDFQRWLNVQLWLWRWWSSTARFPYDCSQQAFGDSLLSVSAVHPALWDKSRYGSLRGSISGSLWTSQNSVPPRTQSERRWNRKRENACVLVSLCRNGWGFGSETVQKGALLSFHHLRAETLKEDKWV